MGIKRWHIILAVSAGNAFEWFDFIIFGYFSLAIARTFFPDSGATSPFLLTLAVFGAAFVMRPLGGILFGHYADRHGRKPALTLSISFMAIGTGLIACTPGHDVLGPVATCLIVAGRLLQGLSAGGEFGSATALLVEQDKAHAGFYASWQFASQAVALVLATSFATALGSWLEPEQLEAWGWRIPFLFGALLAPVVLYIRLRISESPEFLATERSKAPAREMVASFKLRLLLALGLVTVATVTVYTLMFMPSYAIKYLGYSAQQAFLISLCTGVVQVAVIPMAGLISDKWSPRPLAIIANVGLLISVVPLMNLLVSNPTFGFLLMTQLSTGVLLAVYLGVLPVMMSRLFPTQIRTSGLSVSYSFAVAIFGGFAPFIGASLVSIVGNPVAPAYYLVLAGLISLVALVATRRVPDPS